MDGIFSGVSTDNIEKFFMSLIIFDVCMPHTPNYISPITFNDYLIRNQILCLNSVQVYDEACKFWKRYFSLNKDILKHTHEKYDLSICEESHGGWNKLVDHLNRLLDVTKFDGNSYYQMHYIAHCCHRFYLEKFDDKLEFSKNKIIYNEIISPIIYDPVIPTNYSFMPIMNYADIRFSERVALMCARIGSFLDEHSGRTMDILGFDINHLKILHNIVTEGLHGIHENKYNNNSWMSNLSQCLAKSMIIQADVEACELKDFFERDGMKCCLALKSLDKIRKHSDKGIYADDPDTAIDELLDTYKIISDGLKSYNLPKEKDA